MSRPDTLGSGAMRIGFIEPHLRCFGGIRRMVEFANRLTARGHRVVFYLPEGEPLSCDWMRCDAEIRPLGSGRDDPLDVVMFNQESQWYLLDCFPRARRRVFYALHFAHCYSKEGSWESLHVPVDLCLANSAWTADRIAEVTGYRPRVQLGGANREMFHPRDLRRRIPVLCTGERRRAWKGTATVLEAGRIAGVGVRTYAGRGLDQAALGREYARARVFAVGSWYEGFCQPGLEALASGTPLVTTDNGGSREYAVDGETALVVPPKDPGAMALAFRRLLDDPALAAALTANGLDVVAERFDWEMRTDEFAGVLDGLIASSSATVPLIPTVPEVPEVTVGVVAGPDLVATQKVVDSIRWGSDVPYELVIAHSGDDSALADYATAAAARVVSGSGGPVPARNRLLAATATRFLAICEPGAAVPAGWLADLLATAVEHPGSGAVIPAVVEPQLIESEVAGSMTGRVSDGPPLRRAVATLFDARVLAAVGGWDESFVNPVAADVDLVLRVWTSGRPVIVDRGVVVSQRDQRRPDERAWPEVGPHDRKALVARWRTGAPSGSGTEVRADPVRIAEARRALGEYDGELSGLEADLARTRRVLGREGPIVRLIRGALRSVAGRVRPYVPVALDVRLAEYRIRRRSARAGR